MTWNKIAARGVSGSNAIEWHGFSVDEPGLRACGDMTYIGTEEGWLCLADVLDLGSRRIGGYALDDSMRTGPFSRALFMTCAIRGGDVKNMIFHRDRGSHYVPSDFRTLCERNGDDPSVG